jgi:hypothetical protein
MLKAKFSMLLLIFIFYSILPKDNGRCSKNYKLDKKTEKALKEHKHNYKQDKLTNKKL